MPSNKSLALIALMAVFGWLANTSLFVVSEQQRGIQKRLDQLVNDDLMPGLHIKLPVLDKVTLFDGRLQSVALNAHPFMLASRQEVHADVVATWHVAIPAKYANATQGRTGKAEQELTQAIMEQLAQQMSQLTLADLATPRQDEALRSVRQALNIHMQEAFGLAVDDVAIRRITLPEDQQSDVIRKMAAAWSQETAASMAAGEDHADRIHADAERQKAMIMATAQEGAADVKGQIDAEVAALYSDAYARNPAFFRFYQGLKYWREGLQHGNGVLVLGPDDDIMRWIKNER